MKRVILATMMLVLINTVSFAGQLIAKGKTHSTFGDYRLELADNAFTMRGADCKAYKIAYENSPMDVTVVVCKDKKLNCVKYVVLTDKLSLQYVCNNSYFGVEMLDKEMQKQGYKTSHTYLNKFEYFHQKVLGPGQLSEKEATGLIAAYFPFLINESAGDATASR